MSEARLIRRPPIPGQGTGAQAAAARVRRRFTLWPRSLANRTLVSLLVGLVLVQGAGLLIHALDRIELQRAHELREIGRAATTIYRSLATTPAINRADELRQIELPAGATVVLSASPPHDPPELLSQANMELLHVGVGAVAMRQVFRPRDLIVRGRPEDGYLVAGLSFPDGGWLIERMVVPQPRPWHSPTFLLAFGLMTVAAAVLSLWAVRRLIGPVATLADAAERLGRDVNAPPLPEDGPAEVARAAMAFNTMAARIRRFVADRTFLLTAIGHDLRTPITRLKLRAEFIEDDEQRGKFMADLDELDMMVSATLAFGRDAADGEPVAALDLGTLLRTVLDEAADARPEAAERLGYEGPEHLTVFARPLMLKRALTNLVGNAVKYGRAARVILAPPSAGQVVVTIDDDGPGLGVDDLERVFEPFYRVENSRNRETGGTGLGLPIARNILRAHGGDVRLTNRGGSGARATVILPV